MGVTFAIDGIDELRKDLEELGEKIAKKIAVEANVDAAAELQKLLRAAAPYDPTFRKKYWLKKDLTVSTAYYGHLRDAIVVKRVKARKSNYIVHSVSTGDAFWGYFLEFGWTMKSGKHVPAKPWFRPVVDAAAEKLQSIQIEGLRQGIIREATHISGKQRRSRGGRG